MKQLPSTRLQDHPGSARKRTAIGLLALSVLTTFAARPDRAMAAQNCQERRAAIAPLLDSPRPTIEVSINGKSVLMYVDTGSTTSIISPEWALALRLRRDPAHRSVVKTIAGDDLSREVIVTKMVIAGLDFFDKDFVVAELPGGEPGARAAGVIGADIINDFDLELDMPRKTLTFYAVGDCRITRPPWVGAYVGIVGSASNNRFRFPVTLNGRPMMALFDTGSASETVSLDAARRAGVGEEELNADRVVAETVANGHAAEAHRHQFSSLRVGLHNFVNPVMNVVDFEQSGVDMLIGDDYIRLGRFFLAYSSDRIFIQTSLDSADIARGQTPGVIPSWHGPCWLPPSMAPVLAPHSAIVLEGPKLSPPEKVVADHIDGCAAVMFHLSADGTPVDLKLVVESPLNYGIGDTMLAQVAATKYQPDPTETGWYYEARRFRFAPDTGLFRK
jgi:predicted aspartyl protease